MNCPSALFIDSAGLALLQRHLPELEVESEKVVGPVNGAAQACSHISCEIGHEVYLPLPAMAFTRHRLRLAVANAANQPLLMEAGFLSWGRWILTERNPANVHLPSLSPLKLRGLPGLRWGWWPWSSESQTWRHIPGSGRSRRPPRLMQGSAQLLSSFNNPNWYHWLTLPGLGSLSPCTAGMIVNISDRSLELTGAFPTPLLERVSILARAIAAPGLVQMDRGPLLAKQIRACFIENHTPLVCDAEALCNLRRATTPLAVPVSCESSPAMLYLRRGPNARRPLVKEDGLEQALRQRGFAVIDAGSLPLNECIAAFANARWVVAPHGAALANLVFAKPGTRVLELLPGALDKFGHYGLMAVALGLHHSHISGVVTTSGSFYVDQVRVINWLDSALRDAAH